MGTALALESATEINNLKYKVDMEPPNTIECARALTTQFVTFQV